MKNTSTFLGLAVLLLLPTFVLAGPIIRTGESVSIDSDQVLEGDFYGFGGAVIVSGSAENDVHISGGSVTINAPIAEDLMVLGGSVQVHDDIGDDVRIVGGEVTLAGAVGGDVLVMGGTLHILSTASIEGDVLFLLAGSVDVAGLVKGSMTGKAETITIDTRIGGDVAVTAVQTLTLGDRTEIMGNLKYTSTDEIARSQGAVVVGEILKEKPRVESGDMTFFAVAPIFALLFAALTVYLFFREPLQKLTENTVVSYGMQGLIGLALFLVGPMVGFLLLVSILGSVIGVVFWLVYVLILLATLLAAPAVVGAVVLSWFTKKLQVTPLGTVVGIFALSLAVLIPVAGPLIAVAAFFIVLGGIGMAVYNFLR